MEHKEKCMPWLKALKMYAEAKAGKYAEVDEMKALLKLAQPCGMCFERTLQLTSQLSQRIYLIHIEEVISTMHKDECNVAKVEDMFECQDRN